MFDCSKVCPKKCHADCCGYVPMPKELWEKHSEPIIEAEYFSLYRTDNWIDGKEELRRWISQLKVKK